ncbi:type II CAAX prenyl endopeptidase Rce1 family protein [Pedobacter nototheniae]|uniref:CPBP family glutamic-type intramembrane protease n=1 Tax=Pedobacter nototheniae TaxID=2488994 RepID=UPI0039777205
MHQTLINFWKFLKKPQIVNISKDRKSLRRELGFLLLVNLFFSGIVFSTYLILTHFKLIHTYEELYPLEKIGPIETLMLGCIAAPIIEETVFRFPLRKKYLSIYFVLISISVIINYFVQNKLLTIPIYFVFLFASFLIHFYLKRLSLTKVHLLWQKYFGYLFYFSAIFFGCIHISNMKGLTFHDPSFLIYISSQISGGLTLGYLRIKYGLPYSMIFHACFNLIYISVELLFG